jgi:hypothetical protein
MVLASASVAGAAAVARLLGPRFLEVVSSKLNKWTHNLVPVWNPFIPKVGKRAVAAAAQLPRI